MREKLISQVAGRDSREWLGLNYYLTEKQSSEKEETVYGIKVTKQSEEGNEEDVVDNISYNKEEVLELLNLLSSNEVTPVCMAEILDDLMTERMYS